MATGINRQIEALPGFADILGDRETFAASDEEAGFGNGINKWFDELMLQSGMEIVPSLLLGLCLFFGLAVGGVIFIIQEHVLTAALLGFFGSAGPIVTAVVIRSRRRNKMTEQLPSMIDELARAAKTGRSIEQCWELVAHDTPVPLGDELMDCARRMKMGEDLPSAIRDLPQKTGLITLNILVTALSVHQQTGGDLVSVLERLSETIRDRLMFLGRLRAATTGSRATAVLMLTLPPMIITFFSLRDAEYLPKLMDSPWGQGITIVAVLFEVIGSLWILRILQTSQRS